MPPTAVYDSCVLYPAPLRDLLMWLAVTDVVRPYWSDMIHEEWMRSVLADRPDLTRVQLERTKTLMNTHIHDALVEGYEPLIAGLTLPDPDDRHVLAAAIHARAGIIVTFNLKDFPLDVLASYGILSQHPDKFVSNLLDDNADLVCTAVKKQRESLKTPPKSVTEYLEGLERLGLPETAAKLRVFEGVI
jgi:predicted nucleic acid-binding protein